MQVAVDLTPLRPEGKNGGVKVLIITLLQQFQQLEPSYKFILITAPWNHQELTQYESKNVKCLLINDLTEEIKTAKPTLIKKIVKKVVNQLKKIYKPRKYLLTKNNVDLLFCPFSATTYAEKNIPTISIIHDLQHLDYPFLFSDEERNNRNNFLNDLLNQADKIICVSEFTRQSMIKYFQISPSKLVVIPNSIHGRLAKLEEKKVSEYLDKFGINKREYLFYPANYWQHKNHRMLLTAYNLYCQKFSRPTLDLVFTGSLKEEENQLQKAVEIMGLQGQVHFLGYLSEEELTAVWQGCKGLIYPSLYEGFGIPLLEAMSFGKPIISSNVCSLPEVGGDAVIYCDPRKPEEMAACLAKIKCDRTLVNQLIVKGYERVKLFNQEEMVRQYLNLFETVANENYN
jgi:glycosyltransferase involved in cell wall biosynthesis